MAERSRIVMRRLRALLVAVVACLVVVPAASAQTGGTALTGWLANGATFPARGLNLFPPQGTRLSAANVHVTENGHAVDPLTVTPVTSAGPRDFGVMLVIDQSANQSVSTRVAERLVAVAFGAGRLGQQQLGAVTYGTQPHLVLAPNAESGQINAALLGAPASGGGSDLSGAISLALAQLERSGVALGAIVVISDGAGDLTPTGAPSAAALRAAVNRAGVPVIGFSVPDHGGSPTALAAVVPGQVVPLAASHLRANLSGIWAELDRAYVVRWDSHQPSATNVAVQARVDGLNGTVQASYRSGTQTAAPATRSRRTDLSHALTINLAHTPALASSPTFGPPAAAATTTSAPAPAPATTASSRGFLHTTAGEAIIALICGLLFALAVWLLLYRPSQHGVRARVGSYLPTDAETDVDEVDLFGSKRVSGGAFAQSRWWTEFVENVEVSRNPRSPGELVRQGAIGGMLLFAVITVLSGSMTFGLVPLLGWPLVLRALVARAARKQRDKFRDTLPGYLQDLSSALRVGRSFVSAVSVVAETADEPTKSELERAVADDQLGRPLEDSLEAIAERMQAPDLSQVALVAALNRRSGSNVAEALDRVADGSRDRADLRREVKALTAQAKMSSSVLTALPGLLLFGISTLSPKYAFPLLHTTVGIVLLGIGAAMVFAGWKVMKKISNVKT